MKVLSQKELIKLWIEEEGEYSGELVYFFNEVFEFIKWYDEYRKRELNNEK